MISVREIRIGNYLYDRAGILCMVDRIQSSGFSAPVLIGPITRLPNSPIPLTEDWLVKFGFFQVDDDGLWGATDEPIFEVQDKYLADEGLAHVWDAAFTGAPIKYVHQLQNLFFTMTGKELKL